MARYRLYGVWIFKSGKASLSQSLGQVGAGRRLCCKCLAHSTSRPPEHCRIGANHCSIWPTLRPIERTRSASSFKLFICFPPSPRFENVQIPMFENHQSRAARKTRALELLKAVGLEQRVNHFPAKLSGGERQRVAIARSLANSPSVLLADEPTGNLDSESAKHILDLITSLHFDRRMTLILITHDMSVASRASRAIQMKDGQVVFDGDPAKLPRHE